jgi:hypothetical protein
MHFVFSPATQGRVFGVARDSRGQPLEGTVSLMASRRSGAIALPPRTGAAAGGAFEFVGVPPGEYVVRASKTKGAELLEFATQFINVTGGEQARVAIDTAPTATISGRLVLQGDNAAWPGFRLGALVDPDYGPTGLRGPIWSIRDDLTFEMRGVVGPVRIALLEGPRGWWLKSADIVGTNAVENPIVFTGQDDSRTGVEVVLSQTAATLTGRVADDAGRPVDDYWVVLFAADRDRRFVGSQFVRITGGPDTDGGFTIASLPPGDYWVAAVDAIEGDGATGEWQNPEVLDSLILGARRVSVAEGQRTSVDLRLIRRAR